MSSPTQRSLDHMRKKGYAAYVVEKWNPHARIRQDLAGFIDVLCLHTDNERDIVGVQSTSYSNIASRVNKIATHENVATVRKAGIRIVVHGWRKVKVKGHAAEVLEAARDL